METAVNHHKFFTRLFVLAMLMSPVVFIEPAPYDLILMAMIVIAVYCHYPFYTAIHFWPMISLLLFLATNMLSLFFIRDVASAQHYLMITIYCVIAWAGLVGIVVRSGTRLFEPFFKAYMTAALLIIIPSMIAYSQQGTALDIFLWNGRVKGLFKDPNVFGPFLVPPALYALWLTGRASRMKDTWGWLCVFLVISVGILLSFSRAAWGQFVLAMGFYFLFMNGRSSRRMRTLFILVAVFVPVMVYVVMKTNVGDLFFERIGLQKYDDTRFQNQENSLDFILAYPFGFGPGQSELFLKQSTHNLFIRIISENGLLGLLFFGSFCIMTLGRSLYMKNQVNPAYKGYFIIISASLIGIFFNSLFIDTMHWRHFWLLLVLPWVDVGVVHVRQKMEQVR